MRFHWSWFFPLLLAVGACERGGPAKQKGTDTTVLVDLSCSTTVGQIRLARRTVDAVIAGVQRGDRATIIPLGRGVRQRDAKGGSKQATVTLRELLPVSFALPQVDLEGGNELVEFQDSVAVVNAAKRSALQLFDAFDKGACFGESTYLESLQVIGDAERASGLAHHLIIVGDLIQSSDVHLTADLSDAAVTRLIEQLRMQGALPRLSDVDISLVVGTAEAPKTRRYSVLWRRLLTAAGARRVVLNSLSLSPEGRDQGGVQ